jgi:hypothetical protein
MTGQARGFDIIARRGGDQPATDHSSAFHMSCVA